MNINENIPLKNLPVLPLRSLVVFPGQTIPIVVGRKSSLNAVEQAAIDGDWILVLTQKSENESPEEKDLYKVGVISRIEKRVQSKPGPAQQLIIKGVLRFQITSIENRNNYLVANGRVLDDISDLDGKMAASLTKNMKELAKQILSYIPTSTQNMYSFIDNITDPKELMHTVSQLLDIEVSRKQEILEMLSLKDRFLVLLDLMVKVRDDLQLQDEVQQKVTGKLGKMQREAILREQIKALKEELGEGADDISKDYLQKIEKSGMPEETKKIALEQLSRIESMPSGSAELNVIRNYLDLLVSLPWKSPPFDEISLSHSQEILDRDHYGMSSIKKRIIQHLAVMKLKKDKKGSILLFVGPPGTGKTSLAKSIADALGREYVRISLGGVRDDAEIRGHRRTYVGALPGRIIDGIKRAGANNPVFVLDEIDKLSHGWGGDPASALLEVLDPEQNSNFLDHFLDVPFDLSNVFFVATANTIDTIPAPLLDRMERIELTGYTIQEKLHIAKLHLFPKQLNENGLLQNQVQINDESFLKIINSYTREAGVRELQRKLASLIRFAVEKLVSHPEQKSIDLSEKIIEEALGPEKYILEVAESKPKPGVATGLAWTPVGGDILFIESRIMPGKGQLTLTGQLGEIMKESAQIAFSHVRSYLQPLNPKKKLNQIDIHLHVPAGAVPKDGPSAGIAMLASLASLFLGKTIPSDIGMTGEITLRGLVMPVGGIKEKVIAAHRAGIRKVLLPKRNKSDLREVPENVRNDLKFVFLENVEDLLRETLKIELPNSNEIEQESLNSTVQLAN